MGNGCIMQGAQPVALWQPRGLGWGGRWEEGLRGRGHMYSYGWFMLMYGRNQHSIVKQLFSNEKLINLKKEAVYVQKPEMSGWLVDPVLWSLGYRQVWRESNLFRQVLSVLVFLDTWGLCPFSYITSGACHWEPHRGSKEKPCCPKCQLHVRLYNPELSPRRENRMWSDGYN